jgi:uncharacterized protein YjbI with pentapeptide repeats
METSLSGMDQGSDFECEFRARRIRVRGMRRPIGTFYLLAQKLVFCKLRSRQIAYENAYDLFVPHGCASHGHVSHRRVSHGRVSHRRASRGCVPLNVHPTGVYLMSVHLTGVHLMGLYLTGVHLMGMHLTGVYLMGMHLMGVHLTGVHLRGYTSFVCIS